MHSSAFISCESLNKIDASPIGSPGADCPSQSASHQPRAKKYRQAPVQASAQRRSKGQGQGQAKGKRGGRRGAHGWFWRPKAMLSPHAGRGSWGSAPLWSRWPPAPGQTGRGRAGLNRHLRSKRRGGMRGRKRAGRVAEAATRWLRACQMLRMRRAWRARGELTA